MESSPHYKRESSALLFNEIEILSTQLRLIELYVKQTQAAAANVAARMHQEHQAELTARRPELGERERTAQERKSVLTDLEPNPHSQIQALQTDLEEKHRLLNSRYNELQRATSEFSSLLSLITQLESVNREAQAEVQEVTRSRESLQVELAALRRDLEQKDEELQQQRAASKELEGGLHNQLRQLQNLLTAKHGWLETKDRELQQAQTEIAELLQRIAALEAGQSEAQSAAARELEQTRARFEKELAALQSGLRQKDQALQERHGAITQVEQNLQAQIHELQNHLEQKEELVEHRESELEEVRPQIASLQERIVFLETANQQAAATADKVDFIRRGLESELIELREEINRKATTLAEHQASVTASEQTLRAQVLELENQLAKKHRFLESKDGELQRAKSETMALRKRISELEATSRDVQATATRQDELVREKYESELAGLRAVLQANERALEEREAAFKGSQERLSVEFDQLQALLAEKQFLIDTSDSQLQQARSETATLLEQKSQTEFVQKQTERLLSVQGEQIRERVRVELEALDAQLQERNVALHALQDRADEVQERLNSKINELQLQLAEKQLLVESGNAEVNELQANVSGLLQQMAQLESTSKRAQVTATGAAEKVRQEYRAELRALQEELHQKQLALEEQRAEASRLETRHRSQVDDLQNQFAQKEELLRRREHDLETASFEKVALQERLALIELSTQQEKAAAAEEAKRNRDAFQSELAALRTELNQKASALKEQQARAETPEHDLKTQIQGLETLLEDQQKLLGSRHAELERAERETDALRGRIDQLEADVRHREKAKTTEANQVREQFQAQLEALQVELELRTAALQERESVASRLEQTLRTEIRNLRTDANEKHALLQRRDEESLRVNSEMDLLREQAARSKEAAKRAETRAASESAQLRTEFHAQLTLLQAELNQKEHIVEEQQAAVNGLEQGLRAQIEDLRNQLAEKQLLLESRNNEVNNLRTNANELLERVAQLESKSEQVENKAADAAERNREVFHAELRALQAELHQKQLALEEQQAEAKNLETGFRSQIDDLQKVLAEKGESLRSREHDLETASLETVALRGRLALLESSSHDEKTTAARDAEHSRKTFEAELTTLRAELQQKDWTLAQRQAAMENLAQGHKSQIQKLEGRLLEQQRLADNRHAELQRTESERAALLERIAKLEKAVQHAEAPTVSRVEQTRQESEARLATLRAELLEKTTALQERSGAVSQLDKTLQAEIHYLRMEAQEKHALLESRNEELVRVKSEIDLLQERCTQREVAAKRVEEAAASESERMRTEFQAQLALLQVELSQKEWALEEQRATVSGMEQNFNAQIQDLQTQLTEKRTLLESHHGKFVFGEPGMTDAQKERFDKLQELLDTTKSGTEQTVPTSHSRRWRTGLGWNRRWKT